MGQGERGLAVVRKEKGKKEKKKKEREEEKTTGFQEVMSSLARRSFLENFSSMHDLL